MKKLTTLVATLGLAFMAHAQTPDFSKLDSLFDRIQKNDKGMGSLSIFQNGEEIYQKSFGYAEVGLAKKADKETKYRVGSVSKTFTAAIIMQMVDEGKLSLNTPLSKYFPEIPNSGTITLEHLLRHRSGLYNFTNAPDYSQWLSKPHSRQDLLALFIKNGSTFGPGEKTEYSNTNYVLLSFIAEEVDKKPFSEILAIRVVRPLKLSNTYLGEAIAKGQKEAFSYKKSEGKGVPDTETDMSIPMGAGAVVSTPQDLNRFYAALFSGKIVSPASLQLMTTLVDRMGIGLFQFPFYEKRAWGHTGGIDGFQSNAAYFKEEGIAVAYTASGVDLPVNDILLGVLSIVFNKPYELPTFAPALEVDEATLDTYVGVYGSETFPLKFTITRQGKQLMCQASGQGAFPLEAYELTKFKFDPAMIKIEFIPAESTLIFQQAGRSFTLAKE